MLLKENRHVSWTSVDFRARSNGVLLARRNVWCTQTMQRLIVNIQKFIVFYLVRALYYPPYIGSTHLMIQLGDRRYTTSKFCISDLSRYNIPGICIVIDCKWISNFENFKFYILKHKNPQYIDTVQQSSRECFSKAHLVRCTNKVKF